MTKHFAIVLRGFPGVGKTAVARELLNVIPKSKLVEIDSFRKLGALWTQYDNNSFLQDIDKNIKYYNLIICKNHHTLESLQETLDVLKRNNSDYVVFNFVPENFEKMDKDEQNKIIDILLDRIEMRTDNSSALEINAMKSREQAKRTIIYGFVKKYETIPDCIQLDFNASIMENVSIIYNNTQEYYLTSKKRKII
jgi:negative regulator of genetic competence, sporulation and motility